MNMSGLVAKLANLAGRSAEKKQALRRRDFLTAGAAASVAGALTPEQSAAQSLAGAKCYAASGPAKPWTIPQRPGPPVSIDVHTHWAPEGYLKAKAEYGR